MAEWVERKFSDIGIVVGGATPSTKKSENYENGKIAWITPKDLSTFSGRYIKRGERNITDVGLKSCSTQLLPKNTVLFSSRAPIGYIAIAANEVCTNQGFKSVVPNSKTDPLFLFYLLKYNKDRIENNMVDAAIECGATVVQKCFHMFSPFGVSGVVIIAESHLSIHTWPELGYAAVDLFTCGTKCDPKVAYEFLKNKLNSKKAFFTELNRGILNHETMQLTHKTFELAQQIES